MKFWFSYTLRDGNTILRIGKSHCAINTREDAARVLGHRYRQFVWTNALIDGHISEAAALKAEARKIEAYINRYGVLPPYNSVRGGGGRQVYYKCKALKTDYSRCYNDALERNRGFCGVHRRIY